MMKTKRRVILIVLLGLLLLVLVVLSFVPRVTDHKTVELNPDSLAEYSLYDIDDLIRGIPQKELGAMEVITIRNVWSATYLFVIPCYSFSPVTDAYGNTSDETYWEAEVAFLTKYSNASSIPARLNRLKVEELYLVPGPDEMVDRDQGIGTNVYHSARRVKGAWDEAGAFAHLSDVSVDILQYPGVKCQFHMKTQSAEAAPDQQISCAWSYTLYCCGKAVQTCDNFTVSIPYHAGSEALAFPGTRWDMTPEELTEALKLGDGVDRQETPFDAQSDNAEGIYSIAVKNYKVFGSDAEVAFLFSDYNGDGVYGLSSVRVAFAVDADMAAIRDAMVKEYGEPVSLDNGQQHYDADFKQHVARWESEATLADSITDQQLQSLQDQLRAVTNSEAAADPGTQKLCWVYWSDEAGYIFNGDPETYTGPTNCLTFSSAATYLRQKFS